MIANLLLAAALPLLFIDADPPAGWNQKELGCAAVPVARAAAWKDTCAETVDTTALVTVPAPGVNYRMNQARASSAPWVETNGARFLRLDGKRTLVRAGEGRAALAAAEAHAFGVNAVIAASAKDLPAFAAMRSFLSSLPADSLPRLANVGFVDDGTADAEENMKLLLRRNLLFRRVTAPDKGLAVNVKPQSGDPSAFAYEVRQKVGDDKRLLRLYGSEVVIALLAGDASRRRVSLLNYGNRPAEGLRIRVAGDWPKIRVHAFGLAGEATDVVREGGATEFSLPHVPAYTVVELSR